MEVSFSDVVAVVSAGVALLALFVSLYASFVSQRIATSDFKAAETVKSETAQFIAVLRSLVIKGVVYSQQNKEKRDSSDFEGFIDTRPEREAIEKFMNSPTALAYYSFVAKKSKIARGSGKNEEEWRTFFLLLAELQHTNHPWHAAKSAAQLERMFDGIREEDFREMANYLSDLPKAISFLLSEREHDVVMHVMVKHDDKEINRDNFIEFVKYLREVKKVDDLELDVFWAASSDDVELIKYASEKGANLQVTADEIINRYREYVAEFMERHD